MSQKQQTKMSTKDSRPVSSKPGKSSQQSSSSVKLLDSIPARRVEKKLNKVLNAVKTLDGLCDFQKCKTKTTLMGHDCTLCKKRFCFQHGLPEVHGCGDAIRKLERRKFLHPSEVSLPPTKKQEETHRQAKARLDAKIKDMTASRKQKQQTGNKKDKR